MPRKGSVPVPDIVSEITKWKTNIVGEGGKIAGPTHEVWNKVSLGLHSKISERCLYSFVKCNRHNIWVSLEIPHLTETVDQGFQNSDTQDETSSKEGSNYPLESEEDSANEGPDKKIFSLILKPEEWEQIYPITKNYKCTESGRPLRFKRDYITLAPREWTGVIYRHFWETTKLPCVLSFKRAKVFPAGKHFLVFTGKCEECLSTIQGYTENEPDPGSAVRIDCIYSGNFNSNHSACKKRVLTGKAREAAITAMTTERYAPSMYQKLEAGKRMELGDTEPGDLPSLNSLRIAKCRSLQQDTDPVTAIHILKYTSPYNETIKDVGLDKFFVHYWSPAAIHVYRSYHQSCRNPSLQIDATGSLVKKIKRPLGNKSGHLFLYQVTVYDQQSRMQYSVANMISERHDSGSIYHWLFLWIRDSGLIPKECICDHSLALLSACVRAFTQFSTLDDYVKECSSILTESDITSLPTCYIRCDIAHTVKIVATWDPLRREKRNRIKAFYVRSMAQVILSTNIKDIENLLTSIFTVALSPFEGTDVVTGRQTHCEIRKTELKNRIATGAQEFEPHLDGAIHGETTEYETPTQFSDVSLCNANGFREWARNIADACKLKISREEGDHDNLQHLPEIVPVIINFVRLLPLWSSVMTPFFPYSEVTASSSAVESSFNDLKKRVFSHKVLPLRVDDFLKTHIVSLEGTMKLVVSRSKKNYTDAPAYSASDHQAKTIKTSESTTDHQTKTTQTSSSDHHIKTTDMGENTSGHHTQTTGTTKKPIQCVACSDGNFPTGAHACRICKIPVHLFEGCSLPVDDSEEGFGQERVCMSCHSASTSIKLFQESTRTENWRALGVPPKKRHRTSYLEPQTEFRHINLQATVQVKTIGLLKNGNRASQLKAIKVKGIPGKTALTNTCAFDTLAQIMACAYCDSEVYTEFVDTTEMSDFWLIVKTLVETGVTSNTYRLRAQLLVSLFQTSLLPSGIRLVSAESTIAEIAKKVLSKQPTALDYHSCSNTSCRKEKTTFRHVITVIVQDFTGFSIETEVQKCLLFSETECPDCNSGVKTTVPKPCEYHIFVELLATSEAGTDISPPTYMRLREIPDTLSVENKIYSLRGAVAFTGAGRSIKAIGHYVALCKRQNRHWELYNDLEDKKCIVQDSENINCQMLVYTK